MPATIRNDPDYYDDIRPGEWVRTIDNRWGKVVTNFKTWERDKNGWDYIVVVQLTEFFDGEKIRLVNPKFVKDKRI